MLEAIKSYGVFVILAAVLAMVDLCCAGGLEQYSAAAVDGQTTNGPPWMTRAVVVGTYSSGGEEWYLVRLDSIDSVQDFAAVGPPGYLRGDRVLVKVFTRLEGDKYRSYLARIMRHDW